MKKALIAFTILASALSGAQAGIILNDSFNYNAGSTPVDIVGAPGSAWIPNSGTTTMQVATNSLIVTSARSQDIYRPWQSGPVAYISNSASVLYSSYTLHCTALPTWNGTYFSHFAGTNVFTSSTSTITGHRCRVWASFTNYTAGGFSATNLGQFYLNIISSAETGENPVTWTATTLDTNTTYTVVTRYTVASGQSTLWINPSSEASTSVTDNTALPYDWTLNTYLNQYYPQNGPVNISSYNFRQNGGEGTQIIGNLKVGTRFADVAGANTAPLLNAPVNQNTPMNTTIGPLAFTVQDAETPANELTVTASSSNASLVPNGNISLGSDVGGTNRTVTIIPATGQQGATTITLVVNDSVNYTTNAFILTVGAPTVGAIANQVTALNTATAAVPFTAGDSEGDALTFTASSSNPTLVTPADVHIGVAVPNVSSNVVVTPESGQNGVATITLNVSDGHNIVSTSFKVTVTPAPLGVIYNENFAYTGFDIPQALYNATGGSGATWNTISGTAYQIQVTNVTGSSGFAYLVYSNSEDLGAAFSTAVAYDGSQGYVFYTSFTVDCSFLPSSGGDYFFHLSSSGTDTSNFRDKIFDNTANAAAGKFRFGIANTATSPVQVPRDCMTNGTYAVVSRYNAATGDSTLWVNPMNEQSPSITASDAPQSSTIGGVALRQPSCCIGNLAIGPMKVGTAFSDVWTAPAQPVLNWMTDGSGNLIMSWDNPLFVLQSASNAGGPYTDVTPTSPYTNAISGQQYFRLRY